MSTVLVLVMELGVMWLLFDNKTTQGKSAFWFAFAFSLWVGIPAAAQFFLTPSM